MFMCVCICERIENSLFPTPLSTLSLFLLCSSQSRCIEDSVASARDLHERSVERSVEMDTILSSDTCYFYCRGETRGMLREGCLGVGFPRIGA